MSTVKLSAKVELRPYRQRDLRRYHYRVYVAEDGSEYRSCSRDEIDINDPKIKFFLVKRLNVPNHSAITHEIYEISKEVALETYPNGKGSYVKWFGNCRYVVFQTKKPENKQK